MPASEAQIRANKANAAKSSGPRTVEGKDASRANSYKHGLTATKVYPEREADEVQRRYASFCRELNPSGEVGMQIVMRAAVLSTRMERIVQYETAMLTERVREAQGDFVAPEDVDAATAAKLRSEVGRRALFDTSKDAILARKYEAAAERGFFRCLKELRVHEKAIKTADEAEFGGELGSFLPGEMTDQEFERMYAEAGLPDPQKVANRVESADLAAIRGGADVPIAIGKRR
jgi:hypothetical protein